MESTWYLIHFGLRILFVALIYLFFWFVLRAVRKELRESTKSGESVSGALGRLRVTSIGNDTLVHIGKVLELKNGYTVGKGSTNNIILNDPYVSTEHAIFRWNGHAWSITDKSTHGATKINGKWVKHQTAELPFNSQLELGAVQFELIR